MPHLRRYISICQRVVNAKRRRSMTQYLIPSYTIRNINQSPLCFARRVMKVRTDAHHIQMKQGAHRRPYKPVIMLQTFHIQGRGATYRGLLAAASTGVKLMRGQQCHGSLHAHSGPALSFGTMHTQRKAGVSAVAKATRVLVPRGASRAVVIGAAWFH